MAASAAAASAGPASEDPGGLFAHADALVGCCYVVVPSTVMAMRIEPPQKVISQHYLKQAHLDALYEAARTSGVNLPAAGPDGAFKQSLYNFVCFARGRIQVGQTWHESHAMIAEVLLAIKPQSLRKRLCVSLLLYGNGAVAISKNGDEAFWELVIQALEGLYLSHVNESGAHESDEGALRELLRNNESLVLTFDPDIAQHLHYRLLWKSFGYVFRITLAYEYLPATPARDYLFTAPSSEHARFFNALPRAERYDWYIGTCSAFGDSHHITPLNVAWEPTEVTFASFGISLAAEADSPFVAEVSVASPDPTREEGGDDSDS
jgi:hypothetical protein